MAIIENAVTLLKKDHLLTKGLFKSLKAADKLDMGGRDAIFNKLKEELDIHTEIEETIFYPAVRAANHGSEHMVEHSFEEHAEVKELLSELASTDKTTDTWSVKLEKLETSVLHHIKEEEDVLLPRAEEVMGEERMKDLGREILEAKERWKNSFKKGGNLGATA